MMEEVDELWIEKISFGFGRFNKIDVSEIDGKKRKYEEGRRYKGKMEMEAEWEEGSEI